jgi:hypothetical protein
LCAMCGKQILDTKQLKAYKQSTAWDFGPFFEKGIEFSKGWKMVMRSPELSFSSIEWCIVKW